MSWLSEGTIVIFLTSKDIRVRCDGHNLRLGIMKKLDDALAEGNFAEKKWKQTHYFPEGGFLKALFTKGDVDPSTMKRKLKKGHQLNSEHIRKALESDKIKYEKTVENVIRFKYDSLLGFLEILGRDIEFQRPEK